MYLSNGKTIQQTLGLIYDMHQNGGSTQIQPHASCQFKNLKKEKLTKTGYQTLYDCVYSEN